MALIGVWNWRGTNGRGGKTALPEWEHVALNGRKVYVVFDSDVMEKREVHAALRRLKGFLESRDAKVMLIYLPAGKHAKKQGADDYLASGRTLDDLLSHATPTLKYPPLEDEPKHPYRATPVGLVWDKPTQNGSVATPLTNFTARITADVAEDDGAELRRYFEIEADLNGRRTIFSVSNFQFAGMGWATERLGAGAIVYPGFGIKDHTRAAVQMLSGEVPARHVYSHTGWRKLGGRWLYLHAGGAIGQEGQVGDVHVELSGGLQGRTLPELPEVEDLVDAIRASLAFWELAPETVTLPLHAATYRAALGDTDFSEHLSGPTGEGKSELAALCQQHYGPELDARRLTSWESTDNALEAQAFQAKDQLMVLDDFAPTGGSHDVQRWHKKADRVIRAKGNASGRQRMRPDTTLRPERPPRALILSTGEDVPRGQSLRARMLALERRPLAAGAHAGRLDRRDVAAGQRLRGVLRPERTETDAVAGRAPPEAHRPGAQPPPLRGAGADPSAKVGTGGPGPDQRGGATDKQRRLADTRRGERGRGSVSSSVRSADDAQLIPSCHPSVGFSVRVSVRPRPSNCRPTRPGVELSLTIAASACVS